VIRTLTPAITPAPLIAVISVRMTTRPRFRDLSPVRITEDRLGSDAAKYRDHKMSMIADVCGGPADARVERRWSAGPLIGVA
jgi:hypothetical protein